MSPRPRPSFPNRSALGVAGSTLLVAATYQPVQRRVQRLVDRRFNRTRFDAGRIAAAFAALIRDQVDMGSVVGSRGESLGRTVQPASAGVWIRRTEA